MSTTQSIVAHIESLHKQGKTPQQITDQLFPGAETTAFAERVIARLDNPAPAKRRKPRRPSTRRKTFRADSVLSSLELTNRRIAKAQADLVERANGDEDRFSTCDTCPTHLYCESQQKCIFKDIDLPGLDQPPADSITWNVAGQTITLRVPRDDDDSGPGTPPAVQASFRLIPFTAAGRTSLLGVF